MTRSAD